MSSGADDVGDHVLGSGRGGGWSGRGRFVGGAGGEEGRGEPWSNALIMVGGVSHIP